MRLCYWNVDARVVDAGLVSLEQHLNALGGPRPVAVKSLEPAVLDAVLDGPCDLAIIAAQSVDPAHFATWLRGLAQKIKRQNQIWMPALILSDAPFSVLREILPEARAENWYFDILAPAHLSSLPIRVANLLRIHDHLRELRRYEDALEDVSAKVKSLEARVAHMQP